MKIAIISPVFPYPKRGILPGIESVVENLAIHLHRLGNTVRIITSYWNGNKKFDNYKGIPIIRVCDSRDIFGKIGSIFQLNYITFGMNVLRKKNYKFYNDSDVIILPLAIGFTRFYKIKKIPVISIFHHYMHPVFFYQFFYLPFYNYLEKRQFKIHRNVVAVSDSSKSEALKYYNLSSKDIRVIHNGVNLKKFNPNKNDPQVRELYGKNILLFVGPFIFRKRIPILLKAMRNVIKDIPDAHLLLIGKGDLWNYCKNLTVSLGIQKNTTFLGFIKNKELLKYYASSDLFILPSEREGFGQVIIEAMASGTPVICANKPPMSEIIENGGKKFKLNNPKDLSQKIIKLLKNKEDLLKLRKNSLLIVKKYDWINIAKNYINYIHEIKNYHN